MDSFCGSAAQICGNLPMKSTRLAFFVFPVAGLCSGVCSGISVVVPPLGIFVPGILFGLALTHSLDTTVTRLTTGQRAAIIAASSIGFIAAIITCLLSARLPGFDNVLLYSTYAGAIAGGTGAVIVAAGILFTISEMSLMRTLLLVPAAGALFGAGFMFLGVYISDHTSFGHPFDDLVSFPLWQTGVASVFPACQRLSAVEIATEQSGEREPPMTRI